MAAVVWHITMSLDGFIAGPDDAMEWVFDYFSEEVERDCRRGDRVDRGDHHGPAHLRGRGPVSPRHLRGRLDGPYFVLTHEPPSDVPDWMTGTFIDEDIEAAVARARRPPEARTSES